MAPGSERDYTYPFGLREEIEKPVGKYVFDVEFRTEERDRLLSELYRMTEKHFRVVNYFLQSKEWDLFVFVEIGLDRIQHAFWKFSDPEHHLYEPGSRYKDVIKDYYKYLDEQMGKILKVLPHDTAILVVSDHGAKGIKGAFCINEWLAKEGYLVFHTRPMQKTNFEKAQIDWSRTRAWALRGDYAFIFFNVKGRAPQGVIKPKDYKRERGKLAAKIKEIRGPNGELWKTKVFKPEEIYDEINGGSRPYSLFR